MLKIRRYYNQNKKTIWKVTGIIVFFILLIQLLNYFAKSKNINNISNNINNNSSFINNSNYTDLSVSSDKSVLSNEKMTTSSSSELETINQFFNYCNNGEVDKAYSLLSDECKQEMYPELKYFKNNYYKTVFNGKKKNISIENWTGSTYKTDINDDILSTGIYNKNNIRQEYITTIKTNDNQYKLNINNYIGRKVLEKSCKSIPNVELLAKNKDIFMDYEIYTFKIRNNTEMPIMLDNLKRIDSMYLEDSQGLKYSSYTNEIASSELLIRSKETREIKIKYYNKYTSNRIIRNIVFSRVITEYTQQLALNDYYNFSNYQVLKVEL